eukprot:12036-Heterococcus_DN1.PRE.1
MAEVAGRVLTLPWQGICESPTINWLFLVCASKLETGALEWLPHQQLQLMQLLSLQLPRIMCQGRGAKLESAPASLSNSAMVPSAQL